VSSNHIPDPDALSKQVRVISCAWGADHVLDFLEYCLPALLSPGNLPALCELFDCELVFLTEESRFGAIAEHPSWRSATRVCAARLIALDDLLIGPDSYGMTLTQALHRGFADLGPAMTSTWQLFFNSDFIVADGGLKSLAQRMRADHRLILAPSYCINSEPAKRILNRARDSKTSAISVSSRSMAAMILRHRHATVRGKTVNQPLFSHLYNDQFYWLVDNYTLLGHQTPIAMVAMMPLVYLPEPTTYWDYGIIQDFLPNVSPLVLSDSDDFVMAELRPTSTGQNYLQLGPRTISEMAASLPNFATCETVKISEYQLILHSRDKPAGLENTQAKLSEVVRQVIAAAGTLPHHQGHFQWSAHIDRLRDGQKAYLASRLQSLSCEQRQGNAALPVRTFPKSSEVLAPLESVAVSTACEITQCECRALEYPFERADEAEITKRLHRLFEPAIICPPLTETSALELSIRFRDIVDLLLRCRFFPVQEAYRRAARVAINTRLAYPTAEKGRAHLLEPLRLAVLNMSESRHALDSAALQLSGPLVRWIEIVWGTAASLKRTVDRAVVRFNGRGLLRQILATPGTKPKLKFLLVHMLTLAVVKPKVRALLRNICELPAIKPHVRASIWRTVSPALPTNPKGELLKQLQELFPPEQSQEDFEAEMTRLIREAVLSDVVDVESLGNLFVRTARLTFERTLLVRLSALEMSREPEQVVLRRMSNAISGFLEQFSMYAHLVMMNRNLWDHEMRRRRNEFHALLQEASDTLAIVEKLARGLSDKGILGIPLAKPQGSPLRARLRSLRQNLRWFHYSHASQVHFTKFLFERGNLYGKTILHIDAGTSFSYSFTEDVRARYWLPVSIARNPFALRFDEMRLGIFDLCIVDTGEVDLASWSSIYEAVERMIRSGGRVIFFARRMGGLELHQDDSAFIRGMFSVPGYARISYTDSRMARLASRIVEFGRGIYRYRDMPLVIVGALEAAIFVAAAPLACSAAVMEHLRKCPAPARVPVRPISVAMEVSVP
jgi:hypothetical protein